jgi:hypothetical protein
VSVWSPTAAMLWESWRITWRQLVLFCALAGFSGWALLAVAGFRCATVPPYAGQFAASCLPRVEFAAFVVLVCVAIMALASMCTVTGRAKPGFPDSLAFGRPVRTALFVAVPMLYRAAACAAIYAIPTALLRATYGVAFPVAPVAVLLAAGAIAFVANVWFTRDAKIRTLTTVALVLFGVPAALRWLHPWNAPAGPFPPRVAPDLVTLSAADYALIALLVGALYFVTVSGVERQRHGGGGGEQAAPRPLPPAAAQRPGGDAKGIVEHFRDAALAIVRWPCPTTSPLAAELWIETTARALPVLAIGLLLALCVPLLITLGNAVQPQLVGVFLVVCVTTMTVFPFFAAISTSFWNREASMRAPMNAFEATRPIATARLVAVQIIVAAGAILGAWSLIAVSFWFSLPLAGADTALASLREPIALSLRAVPVRRLVGIPAVGLVAFSTGIAMLAAIRAFSAVHGNRIWLGLLGLGLYAIFAIFAILTERWSTPVIGAHLWAAAAAIPAVTVFVMARAVTERILLPRDAGITLAVWAALAMVGWLVVRDLGFTLRGLPPVLAALTLAAALLPLTASVLAVWSQGLIRHA